MLASGAVEIVFLGAFERVFNILRVEVTMARGSFNASVGELGGCTIKSSEYDLAI